LILAIQTNIQTNQHFVGTLSAVCKLRNRSECANACKSIGRVLSPRIASPRILSVAPCSPIKALPLCCSLARFYNSTLPRMCTVQSVTMTRHFSQSRKMSVSLNSQSRKMSVSLNSQSRKMSVSLNSQSRKMSVSLNSQSRKMSVSLNCQSRKKSVSLTSRLELPPPGFVVKTSSDIFHVPSPHASAKFNTSYHSRN